MLCLNDKLSLLEAENGNLKAQILELEANNKCLANTIDALAKEANFLTAKCRAQTTEITNLEDCIAEMAGLVYA